MPTLKSILYKLKPGISKRALFFLAGLVWTFAGSILLYKGSLMLAETANYWILKLILCIIAGLLFYNFVFDEISFKHTNRIKSISYNRPCAFSFFNWKSYLMMASMIIFGVALRATGIVPTKYLALLYITMGMPLTMSAIRFYSNGFRYHIN